MFEFIGNLEPNYIFVLGMFIGVPLGRLLFNRKFAGVLRIDRHNPEKDVYKIEIEDLDQLSSVKQIILKVDNDADLSQK